MKTHTKKYRFVRDWHPYKRGQDVPDKVVRMAEILRRRGIVEEVAPETTNKRKRAPKNKAGG